MAGSFDRCAGTICRSVLFLAACHFLTGQALFGQDEDAPQFDPTENYEVRDVEGWTVLVNRDFLKEEPELADRTLEILRIQLYQTARVVPPGAVKKLRRVKIWVEEQEPNHACMAYHPDPNWLRRHGMNPEKAGCVELANAHNFIVWTIPQPWMVLHELAHAYHHQFLDKGFENPDVLNAYRRSMDEKRYDSVLHINGRKVEHYAAKNQMEYFAEATEAYFGTNDFYPFVRAELKEHDPEMHELLKKLWQVESAD